MPIIHMITDLTKLPNDAKNLKPCGEGPEGLHTYETHHGLCVAEREHNMYDDSDFYMVVLDEETDTFKEVMFASTRGWTYPCMASHRDAPKDLLDRYLAEQQAKRDRIAEGNIERAVNARAKLIAATGLSFEQVQRIEALDCGQRLMTFMAIKVRSEFKKSLQQRIRDWSAEANPTYKTPLSPRQLAYAN